MKRLVPSLLWAAMSNFSQTSPIHHLHHHIQFLTHREYVPYRDIVHYSQRKSKQSNEIFQTVDSQKYVTKFVHLFFYSDFLKEEDICLRVIPC